MTQYTANPSAKDALIDRDDQQLMTDYASGNRVAFEQLYSRYEQALYRYLFNSCSDEASAGELFQDIWLRVVKARNSYKPAVPFRAWLFTIAKNRLTDHYRQQSRNLLHSTSQTDTAIDLLSADHDIWRGAALTPEQIASASETNDTLRSALERLPDAQREAIMLKHIVGMELGEIADIQGEGAQTVKSRLRYAMVKLRQHLQVPS